jgi:hypothetical protein
VQALAPQLRELAAPERPTLRAEDFARQLPPAQASMRP